MVDQARNGRRIASLTMPAKPMGPLERLCSNETPSARVSCHVTAGRHNKSRAIREAVKRDIVQFT